MGGVFSFSLYLVQNLGFIGTTKNFPSMTKRIEVHLGILQKCIIRHQSLGLRNLNQHFVNENNLRSNFKTKNKNK
jgi:hypothetical protein